jgi:hypothetical protein
VRFEEEVMSQATTPPVAAVPSLPIKSEGRSATFFGESAEMTEVMLIEAAAAAATNGRSWRSFMARVVGQWMGRCCSFCGFTRTGIDVHV